MAKTATGLSVGDYVYKPFDILKPGKIVKVGTSSALHGPHKKVYEVKWLVDGSSSIEWELHLNDFNHATDEHLKKYNKFDAIRQKLKAL